MNSARVKSDAPQAPRQFIGNHDGTMAAARAANPDRQIRLAFALILRQEVIKQICKALQRVFDLGLVFQVLHDAPVAAGKRPEFSDEKRVRQMTDIEKQFHLARRAESVAKA